MSGAITGGTFSFARTVKTGDFENKKAEAEISFTVDDGKPADDIYANAITLAQNGVLSALGLPPVKEVPNVGANGADAAKEAYASRRGSRRKPPTPDDPNGMDVVTTQGKDTAVDATFDPLAVDGSGAAAGADVSKSQAGTAAPSEESGEFDPLSSGGNDGSDATLNDILTGEAEEITDADLVAKITAKNNETKNTQAIRRLIGQYTPQDGNKHSANEIAQDKRAAFILELAAVTAP